MLPGPHLAGDAHTALDFVENKEHFIFVADLAQLLEELGAEVVVSALALDRLNDDRRDAVGIVHEHLLDLLDRLRFEPLDVADMFLKREGDLRVDNARPVGKLSVTLVLVRIVGVRYGEGIARTSVEGFVEVHNLRAFASVVGLAGSDLAFLHELLDLPVHRHFEGVLYRERTVVNEEYMVESLGNGHFAKGLDKFRHLLRVDVGVSDLVDCRAEYLLFKLGIVKFGVVHSKRR